VASDTLPVDFKLDCLFYRTVTDHTLHIIPNCSFHQLYTYFRGTEETSDKCLDRAAKHASAGDITCVKMCQVCNCIVHLLGYTSYDLLHQRRTLVDVIFSIL